MEPNSPNIADEFFEMFGISTRRELIELRECLATELVAAFRANDVVHVTAIESLFDRIENRLRRGEQHQITAATRRAELSGVN